HGRGVRTFPTAQGEAQDARGRPFRGPAADGRDRPRLDDGPQASPAGRAHRGALPRGPPVRPGSGPAFPGGVDGSLTEVLQLCIYGLVLGSVIVLGAIGLSLTYGILNFANFAHGDMMTLGAYLALFFRFGLGLP